MHLQNGEQGKWEKKFRMVEIMFSSWTKHWQLQQLFHWQTIQNPKINWTWTNDVDLSFNTGDIAEEIQESDLKQLMAQESTHLAIHSENSDIDGLGNDATHEDSLITETNK